MRAGNLHKKSLIKRPQRNLKPNKVILIVCEGKKTEKNYFQKLKESLNLISVSIEILPSPHPTPMQVINYAEQKAKEIGEYDEVYCVIDRDTHSDFDEALAKAKSIKLQNAIFEIIVSDPCFEFWVLLHFAKITPNFRATKSPCKELQKHKDFKKNLPHYSKDYDFKDIIANHLNTAIKNANEINNVNLPTRQTPYTEVVRLVERLQTLAKKW